MYSKKLWLSGIFLICIVMTACRKKETDEFGTPNRDTDVNENVSYNGPPDDNVAVAMDDKDVKVKESINGSSDEARSLNGLEGQVRTDDIIKKYKGFSAGTAVDTSGLDGKIRDSLFYFQELDQSIIDRIYGKSYKEYCDIPYSDLRYVRVLHTDFDGQTRIGELIVNKAIAQDVADIFKELYEISYPIEKMLLIDEYDADDIKSMEDNNTSAFNFRYIEGTTKRSVHSYGLAIDINPLYNPYVRTKNDKLEVLPESAAEYADRTRDNIYYIKKDDPCYKAFTSRGFTWGGDWKSKKDYQHFEKKIND